jgi:hypothetical protein
MVLRLQRDRVNDPLDDAEICVAQTAADAKSLILTK